MRSGTQARTALNSALAAAALVAIKLVTGIVTGSLALIAEAAHSAADLVAAALTFFALRIAVRPADRGHPFGHGKAENLAALGEGAFLLGASGLIAYRSAMRLADGHAARAHAPWYSFVVLGTVIAIDATRALLSWRAARRYNSPALRSNAVHFASDLAGSAAVVVGLAFVAGGHPDGDSIAALIVAGLVVVVAVWLIRQNARVLMDESPGEAEEVVRRAIAAISPPVRLRRLRLRQAAGRYFADVVIGVRADAGVGQGHAVADAVERAVEAVLPETDVVVHVEPRQSASLRERVSAAALTVPGVREIHNLTMLEVDGGTEVALHLKLPPEMTLEQAHAVASEIEDAITVAVPQVLTVHTHIEPLSEPAAVNVTSPAQGARIEQEVRDLVRELTGRDPLVLRLRETAVGAILFLTLPVDSGCSLAEAHARATSVEQRIRAVQPGLADVVVHTEPTPGSVASG
jgi:cation diffusion facilitator family transporter